ncbi:hypothetical protein ACG7TL_007914 [Trametes sanguinea]
MSAHEPHGFRLSYQIEFNHRILNLSLSQLPDVPEQEAHDAQMRQAMEMELRVMREGVFSADSLKGSPNQWVDRKQNEAQFVYHAEAEAERWWRERDEKSLGDAGEFEERVRMKP